LVGCREAAETCPFTALRDGVDGAIDIPVAVAA
jgi:hypothetical protein